MNFNRKLIYAIRKSKLGVGSALIGIALFGGLMDRSVNAEESLVETVTNHEVVIVEDDEVLLPDDHFNFNDSSLDVADTIDLESNESHVVDISDALDISEPVVDDSLLIPADGTFRNADVSHYNLSIEGDESVKLKDNRFDWRFNLVVEGQDVSQKGLKLRYTFDKVSTLNITTTALNDKKPTPVSAGGVYTLGDVISGFRFSIPISFASNIGSTSGNVKLELLASDNSVLKMVTKPYTVVAPELGPLSVEFVRSALGDKDSGESIMG